MKLFTIILFLVSQICVAKQEKPLKNKAQTEEKPQIEYKTAKVVIIEKIYSKTTKYKVPIGRKFVFKDVTTLVHECTKNEANQLFALTEFKKNRKTVFKKWIPIEEYNLFPYADEALDITIQDCF